MLDLKRIREEPDVVRAGLTRRDASLGSVVEEILALDEQWRRATSSAESLRAMQRQQSEAVAAGKRSGADVEGELAQLKQVSEEVKGLVEQARVAQEQLDRALARLPNLPDPTAAPGPQDELVR